MVQRNPIAHYGKPMVSIVLGWASLLGLVIALGGESFRSSWWIWIAFIFVHWTTISYLIWLAFDFRSSGYSTPTVKLFYREQDLILVNQKDWLGMNVAVLLYKQEGDYERLLCPGTVINIQDNGLVQIHLSIDGLESEEISRVRTKLNDGNLSSLIIKPGQNARA
jgi:hypothetical protein